MRTRVWVPSRGMAVQASKPSTGGTDRRIPGAGWPASLDKLLSLRLRENQLQKQSGDWMRNTPDVDRWLPYAHTLDTCIYTQTHTYAYHTPHERVKRERQLSVLDTGDH